MRGTWQILSVGMILGYLIGPLASHAGDSADPFAGAYEVFRFSFENDQDQDYDRYPDDWVRRVGREFPHYLKIEIDRTHGQHREHSLRFDCNGGPAILYSPVQPADPLHAYVFRGFIKTKDLKLNAGLISLSFLNHKRQRIQRFLSEPVSGTHGDWQEIQIGPISPHPDTRFIVVGCHLLNSTGADIEGSAWFDNLWLGRLPQLDLVSNYRTQFVSPGVPVPIVTRISGLDDVALEAQTNHTVPPAVAESRRSTMLTQYRLQLELLDSRGNVLDRFEEDLNKIDLKKLRDESSPRTVKWMLNPQKYGIYRVSAQLLRGDGVIFSKQATFAVLDLVDQRGEGEFGWCFPRGTGTLPLDDLVEVAMQGGINWLKYPVWNSVHQGRGERAAAISQFFDLLRLRRVKPVGLLNDPPIALRQKFARNWTGISEIFTQSSSLWSSSTDPVLAKFSSTVQHWQLGDDRDGSFIGIQELPRTLTSIKQQFDQIGRDTRIGVHWSPDVAIPSETSLSRSFFSADQPASKLFEPNQADAAASASKWVLLTPLPKSSHTPEERGADLVKRMVAAKMSKADAIFARDVLDEEHGLLNPDGSPTLLFLPWRNTALALQGAQYLGSLELPGGSRNFLFQPQGQEDVVMFLWNDQPVKEKTFLGDSSQVTAINLWGEQTRLASDPKTGEQIFDVGPTPLLIRGCSGPVARWRLAMQFETGRLASATGVHKEQIIGRNTFSQGVSGTMKFNAPFEWEVEPRTFTLQVGRGEPFRLPMLITLPPNATLGTEQMAIDVEIDADRRYNLRIYRSLEIGLGDVELIVKDRRLENGFLEIEQTLINQTSPLEILNFECSLFIPGSKRQKKLVIRQSAGESKKLYFAPNADGLKGKEIWLRAVQTNGRRVLNYRWSVGKDWDK